MDKYEVKLIKQYLIDRIPVYLDLKKQDLVYNTKDIHYKIYKYIKELEERK